MASEAAVESWRLMRQIAHDVGVIGRTHAVAEEAGITPTLIKALLRLSPDRPTPMRELAGALRCDASYVTSVVDGLEQHGLALRMPHPTDRRIKVVVLTEIGAPLAARARAALDEPPASMGALSDEDTATLLRLLRGVAGAAPAI